MAKCGQTFSQCFAQAWVLASLQQPCFS